MNTKPKLLCFPHAGGGAATYSSWHRSLGHVADLVPFELPGRGSRLAERPFKKLDLLIGSMFESLVKYFDDDFAFFGHSMGALIAFELARELRRRGRRQPTQLFLSGRVAPQIQSTNLLTYSLPEPELIMQLRNLNGTPKEILEDEDLMSLMLPVLRADFELIETHQYKHEAPLECPISVYGGLYDPETSRDALLSWREQTTGRFTAYLFNGDHFFLRTAETELLQLISDELTHSTSVVDRDIWNEQRTLTRSGSGF